MKTGVIDLVIEYQVDVLDKLLEENKIDLKHALTGVEINFHGNFKKFEKLIKKQNHNSQFDPITDFLFANEIIKLSSVPFTISENLLKEVKHIESIFYRISDRSASLPISVHERRLYYLLLLNYFNTIIKENELELIIAFDTPHSIASIIYFELAKHYNLKLILLEYHFLEDMSNIINQYEYPKVPIDYLKNLNKEEITSKIPDFIKNKLADTNVYVSNYKKKEANKLKRKGSISKLWLELMKRKITNFGLGVLPSLSKQRIPHFTSLNNISSNFKYRITLNNLINKLYKLNKYYNKISVKPDLTQKYIFFGLHMQPEKTSQPLGNESDNQFFPIILLSKNVPSDWKIYVKDHPNQYNLRKISNRNYRSENFYDSILNLKNVEIVSYEVPADDLMENAQAVATLSGTIGWEALTIGKPVIAFGNPYYLGCRSVYQLKNENEINYFFQELRTTTQEKVIADFYRYLTYYYENGYFTKGSNWELKIAVSKRDRSWHVENMTESISNYIDKF